MRPFIFAILCTKLLAQEELAIRIEDLPKTPPVEEIIEIETVYIDKANALILLGPNEPLYSGKKLDAAEGTLILLDVPGKKTQLISELDPIYLNQEVTDWTIQSLKEKIYEYYHQKGRPFILVDVPDQDFTSGVLQLRILESRFDALAVNGIRWSNRDQIVKWLDLENGEPINENRLLDRVRFINRNPYRHGVVTYSPGSKNLSTNVAIDLNDQRSVRGYVSSENTGVQWTGRQRWIAGLVWANACNLGHLFSFQYTTSSDFYKFQAYTAQYIAYISNRTILNVYGGYSSVHAHVPGSPTNHGLSGQASVHYTIPLPTINHMMEDLTFGIDYKVMNQTVEFGGEFPTAASNVNVFELLGTYLLKVEGAAGQITAEADLYWSPGKWLPNQSNSDYNALRPGAKAHWVYFRPKLDWVYQIFSPVQLHVRMEGQWSSNNLLPSEQLGIGGYNTVRGYEERQLNKDNGFIGSVEIRLPPVSTPFFRKSKKKDSLVFLGFIDYGYGINHNAIAPIPNSQYLLGAGPGIRYQILPYITGRLDWGWKLHQSSFYGGGSSMAHFSVTGSF